MRDEKKQRCGIRHIRLKWYAVAALLLLAFFVSSIAAADTKPHPAYDLMREAAERMKTAEQVLYARKVSLGLYNAELDPNRTGLIGEEYSRITTTLGSVKAKRTAAVPDFAAYIVRELLDHGIGKGDTVLITMTGSFPGLNLAVLSAVQTLGVSSLRICSLGASSYGANQEEFTWLDMEDLLVREKILKRRTNWVSLGGSGDVGGGLPAGGKSFLRRKADELKYPILKSRSLKKQTELRRELFGDPKSYHLLINIGGNQAMLGKGPEGRMLPGGWIDPGKSPWTDSATDELSGIVFDFLLSGVPVLNLLHIEDVANAAGIPFDPQTPPDIGLSPVYFLGNTSPTTNDK
ncbi:poly-gamma-glutamate system protein [candidate division KSB1 bacterium]|nr:MAG: poly-gamma-glutamate system protein [candidate division KSB1 bacterium]